MPNALFRVKSLSKNVIKNLSHARDGSSHAFNLEGSEKFDQLLKDLARMRNKEVQALGPRLRAGHDRGRRQDGDRLPGIVRRDLSTERR